MSIFLSHEIVVFLLVEAIILVLMGIACGNILYILRHWDFEATTSLQYRLEKRNYLVNTILYFTVGVKITLFLFYVQSLGSLSGVVPGAMCSAGVVGANGYGNPLLLLKILLIFGLGLWITINKLDLLAPNFPYLRRKYWLFLGLFVGILREFALELTYFSNIPLSVPVFCCSVLFQAPRLPFGYTQASLVILFYLFWFLITLLNCLKNSLASFFCNLLFLFIGYYAITYFFGLYVYEMPNHQCPYCMLQREYYYVGYGIWMGLFGGVFFGITSFLVEKFTRHRLEEWLLYSSLAHAFMGLVCTAYVVRYYLINGVFL